MKVFGVELEILDVRYIGSWPIIIRQLILVMGSLGVFFIGYQCNLGYQWNNYRDCFEKKKEHQKILTEKRNQISHLVIYKEQLEKVRSIFNILKHQLPYDPQEAELLEEISQLAMSSGLQFRSIKPLPEEDKEFYTEHAFEIKLLGNYHGFGEFVSNICNIQRIVTLHDFMIKPEPKDPKSLKLELFVVAKTYWVNLRKKEE